MSIEARKECVILVGDNCNMAVPNISANAQVPSRMKMYTNDRCRARCRKHTPLSRNFASVRPKRNDSKSSDVSLRTLIYQRASE